MDRYTLAIELKKLIDMENEASTAYLVEYINILKGHLKEDLTRHEIDKLEEMQQTIINRRRAIEEASEKFNEKYPDNSEAFERMNELLKKCQTESAQSFSKLRDSLSTFRENTMKLLQEEDESDEDEYEGDFEREV